MAAKDAIRDCHDMEVSGKRIKVELSLNKPLDRDRPRDRGPKSNVCYAWRHGTCDRYDA